MEEAVLVPCRHQVSPLYNAPGSCLVAVSFLPLWRNSRHEVIFHLQGYNACHSLINTCLGKRAILESRFDAIEHIDHLRGTRRAEQHIITSIEGQDCRLWHTPGLSNTLHIESIGEHYAIITELFAQDIGHKDV